MAKAKMKEKGLSQERLWEMLGKTQGAIAHWLNGRRELSIEDIAKIMDDT
ncbi:MAG: helix-turn-helix domain-containing protein [Symbiopectobacterium sp.]